MGLWDSFKNGMSNFYDHVVLGKKTVSVENTGQVEAAKLDSDAKIEAAKIDRDTKIKLAQMEQEHKAELAGMEKERVEEWRTAQLEIIQAQALAQMAIDDARAKGMTAAAEYIFSLQKQMTEIADNRLKIIERGSLQIVREIEDFYNEIGDKISAKDDKYNKEKLKELLDELEKFKEGTPRYNFYAKLIENNMEQHHQFMLNEMKSVRDRQSIVLSGLMDSKKEMTKQTGELIDKIVEGHSKQSKNENLLSQGQTSPQALIDAAKH